MLETTIIDKSTVKNWNLRLKEFDTNVSEVLMALSTSIQKFEKRYKVDMMWHEHTPSLVFKVKSE